MGRTSVARSDSLSSYLLKQAPGTELKFSCDLLTLARPVISERGGGGQGGMASPLSIVGMGVIVWFGPRLFEAELCVV